MPAFSFKQQFVAKVESGEKLHTIRAKRKNRPRVGQTFYGYYGLRTKQCRKLVESVITRVQDIVIDDLCGIMVDGDGLSLVEREELAVADGFSNYEQMLRFWDGRLPFSGDIIHWRKIEGDVR